MVAAQRESPDPNHCPLFTLPAELRHQIYAYALTVTFEDPYIARHCSFILNLDTSESPPQLNEALRPRRDGGFNQLKFTCRFLYHETSLLEVKHNAIQLSKAESDKLGPAERFSSFLSACSAEKAALIRNVVLDNDAMSWKASTIEEPRRFLDVADFCRKNTHVNVKYIPNQMSWNWYSVKDVMELGVLISLVVRGKDLRQTVAPGAEFEFEDSWFKLWLDQRDIAQQLNVPNLRFWPLTGSEGFDEEGFRERMGEVGESVPGLWERLDVDACLECVREWRKVGI